MEGIMESESKSLLITKSDDEILELVSATHDDSDQEEKSIVDLDALCSDTDEIMQDSFGMLNAVFDGYFRAERSKFLVDPEASFSTPSWTFVKSIGLEISCVDGDEEIITLESRTLQVLKKLSKYSWEAKVVFAVASFALESVGILKPLTEDANRQHKVYPVLTAIMLIKRTLKYVPHGAPRSSGPSAFLAKLFNNEMTDVKIPVQTDVKIPVQVYWLIAITVASATHIKLVTCQEWKKAHDLSPFSMKLDDFGLFRDAERMPFTWTQERGWAQVTYRYNNCRYPGGIGLNPARSTEVFQVMILPNVSTVQTILIDGSTNQPVDMDVLKSKNLLLLFSGLDISDNGDLSPLKIIYEGTKQGDMHKIVWIPIVESWTADRQRKYEDLRSKMPWYIVHCSSPFTNVRRFIKAEWKFKGKPILVVMNRYGTVININALPLIRKKGMDAFPFHA